ncbi:MAG: hypothetical protein ACFCU4_05265 [Puniceicoccaceae bacterium]
MADTPETQDDSSENNPGKLPLKKPSVKLTPKAPGTADPIRLKPSLPNPLEVKAPPRPAEKVASEEKQLEVQSLAEGPSETPKPTPVKGSILDEIMGAPAQDMKSVEDEWEEDYVEEPEEFDVSMNLDLDDDDDEESQPADQLKPSIKPNLVTRSKLPRIADLSKKAASSPSPVKPASETPVSIDGPSSGPETANKPKLTPKVPGTGFPKPAVQPAVAQPAAVKPAIVKPAAATAPAPYSAPSEFAPRHQAAEPDSSSKVGLVVQGLMLVALLILVIILLKELIPLLS